MKKGQKIFLITLLVVLTILNFLLFPRRYFYLDGGSVSYESFGFGFIYSIEKRHALYTENDTMYYEVGTIITVFGKELFNDAHVDYDDPHPLNVESLNEEVRNFMGWDE